MVTTCDPWPISNFATEVAETGVFVQVLDNLRNNMSVRAGFKEVKKMCISSSPVSTNQEQPSLEEALSDLNEPIDVPS